MSNQEAFRVLWPDERNIIPVDVPLPTNFDYDDPEERFLAGYWFKHSGRRVALGDHSNANLFLDERALSTGTNGRLTATGNILRSTGATFNTDGVAAGDRVVFGTNTYTVDSVTSNTQLVLEENIAADVTVDTAYTIYRDGPNPPKVSDLFVAPAAISTANMTAVHSAKITLLEGNYFFETTRYYSRIAGESVVYAADDELTIRTNAKGQGLLAPAESGDRVYAYVYAPVDTDTNMLIAMKLQRSFVT